MLIGVDFDNTIAGYDAVFAEAAVAEGLLAHGGASTKAAVKAALQAAPDGERQWMRLQGRVYGAHMHRARLIDGVAEFFRACRARGVPLRVVSHKTEFGHFDPDRIDLCAAALAWMESQGFFDADGFGFAPDDIYFEPTRTEKVSRIAALGCTHFIDDLMEVFLESGFPRTTTPLLFQPGGGGGEAGVPAYASWPEISHAILGA